MNRKFYDTFLEGRGGDTQEISRIEVGQGNFGQALAAAQNGKKVSRSGWNGANMYAVIMPGYPDGIAVNEATAKAHGVELGTVIKFRPYWALWTAQGDVASWAPSGSDTLAEDWGIVQ